MAACGAPSRSYDGKTAFDMKGKRYDASKLIEGDISVNNGNYVLVLSISGCAHCQEYLYGDTFPDPLKPPKNYLGAYGQIFEGKNDALSRKLVFLLLE
ncbi:unnamed protein product [Didymodactylos carnosus]|uniref:Uncharacterized protein n=1 Tax=Didymodactylos carnosus TaxID=1234261 RepID=A0A8S2IR25_9BILA|nr:unnamed protein product [Didymodactylos carnosus]CAF3766944.1 unnamed protein product [Didymodactylos carnosus]